MTLDGPNAPHHEREPIMGMLCDFFVGTPEEALRYVHRHDDEDEGEAIEELLQPAEMKGLEMLVLGLLWAILAKEPFSLDRHSVPEQFFGEEHSHWLGELPTPMVQLLAQLDDAGLQAAATQWAATEEMRGDPEVLTWCISTLRDMAQRALREGKGLHYWGCM